MTTQSTTKSPSARMSETARMAVDCLAEAVSEEFERKYRLGYSAVIWRDGKCVEISGEELLANPSTDRGTA